MATRVDRVLVVAATGMVIGVNAIANTRGINGVRTGEVAARYDLPFTPAGWVFSIWGAIYVALLALTLFQLTGRGTASSRMAGVRAPYVFTCVANVAWLWFWHHEALLATLLVMLLLLAALAFVYRTLEAASPESAAEAWCLDAPFSLYTGWISVATLANASVVVTGTPASFEVDAVAWSQLMLAGLLGVVLFGWSRLRDPLFLLVLAWAATGIALKQGQAPSVSLPASVAGALAGMAAIDCLLRPAPPARAEAQSTTG